MKQLTIENSSQLIEAIKRERDIEKEEENSKILN